MGHAIKYSTADLDFDFLPGPFSGLELRANDALKSSHCRFDQRPPMIATVHGPFFPADFIHVFHALIARFDMAISPFTFLTLRMITGWNDRFDGRGLLGRWIGQQPVDMPSIIGAIRVTAGDRCIDLAQQRLELAGIIGISQR